MRFIVKWNRTYIRGKVEDTALEMNLHEERALGKDRGKGNEDNTEDRKSTMFVGIYRAQNTADVVTSEEILHFLGQLILERLVCAILVMA